MGVPVGTRINPHVLLERRSAHRAKKDILLAYARCLGQGDSTDEDVLKAAVEYTRARDALDKVEER